MLRYSDFKTMLSNVAHRVPVIAFTGFTEPSQNPEFIRCATYAQSKGYEIHLSTTLWNQTRQFIEDLDRLSPERLTIHSTDSILEVDAQLFTAAAGLKNVTFESYTEIGFNRLPSGVVNNHAIAGGTPHDRAGSNSKAGLTSYRLTGPVECSEQRYYSNVVLPNGEVVICCQDFGLQYIVGNLMQSSLEEIHNGSRVQEFIRNMRSKNESICNNCIYASAIT